MATNRYRIVDQSGNVVGTVAQDSIITGPDGTQATVTANGLKVDAATKITATDIMVPVDKQAVYRTKAYVHTSVPAANGYLNGETLDGSTFRRVLGFGTADQAVTVAIQQSEDGQYWYTLDEFTIPAGGRTKYDFIIVAPYVRYKVTAGATAPTWMVLTGYLQAE